MKNSTCGRLKMYLRWSFRLTQVVVVGLICFLAYAARGQTLDPFLGVNGVNVRNGHGTGDIVPLRGVNLGGWLVMESWMCPMDSGSLTDMYSLVSTLDTRFGTNTEQFLLHTYQSAWITANDIQNIKNMGMNVVRVPVWWGNFVALDGSWRTDAFDRLDWVVLNAWNRGIYTIIDMHGVVGGQSSSADTGRMNQNQYWSNSSNQNATATIWSNIAVHFNGNPGVAGYDLINEPYGSPNNATLWNMYTSLYQAIRSADPNHIIIMEGGFNGLADLPSTQSHGWTNVIYSAHEYQYNSQNSVSGIEAGINSQTSYYNSHQFLNVPDYIGEFNFFSPGGGGSASALGTWEYGITNFNNSNMSWSPWAYKATHGSSQSQDSWGLYDPSGTFPTVPSIAGDSSNNIATAWQQNVNVPFGINAMLQRALGAPLAVADSYTATSGVTLAVSATGVLANDIDINHNQSGIQMTAVLMAAPANGSVTLNSSGSFSYTSTPGFSGTDTFRYRVYDGYANSANIATVTITVLPASTPAAPTSLTATGSDGLVTLNWNASLGAATYNVKRATTSGGPSYPTIASGVTGTSYPDTGVTNGTTYYYVVSAVNSSGESSNSFEAAATPLSAYQQWQIHYFGNITDPSTATNADPDGDGMSNQQEFLTGSDPTSATSYFHITSIVVQGNGVNVAWMGGGGTTNVLQAISTLDGTSSYSNISPNIVLAGSGMTTTNYLDSGSLTVVVGAASDNASDPAYMGGNFNGANGGTGFGPWVVSPASNTGTAQWFIGSSTTNGFNPPTGGIDSTGGKSWGSFANNGGVGTAIRTFSAGALQTGQVFSLDIDNGYVEAGDSVGFDLQNSSGQTLLEINYIGANSGSSYGSIDGTGAHSLGVPYTDGGVHAQITLTSATTYSASLKPAAGSLVNFSGTLSNPAGGQGITQIQLFDNNVAAGNSGANWIMFWNNFNVTSVTNTVNTGAPTDPMRYYRVLFVP